MSCLICKSSYSWFGRKEYHCKRCDRNICAQCTKFDQKVVINMKFIKTPICVKCLDDVTFIKQTIQKHMCSWNYNSKLAQTWVPDVEGVREQFQSLSYIEGDSQLSQQVKRELADLRFNYSIQEFVFYLWKSIKLQTITDTITKVLQVFLQDNPQVGFNQYLVKITVFLLCLAKDFVVIDILNIIYNKIPEFYHPEYQNSPEFINTSELMVLEAIQQLQSAVQLEQHQVIVCKNFIEHNMVYYKSQLLLNLNFSCALHSIGAIIKQDFNQIDSFFIILVKKHIASLQNPQSEQIILNNTSESDLKYSLSISTMRKSHQSNNNSARILVTQDTTPLNLERKSQPRLDLLRTDSVTDFDMSPQEHRAASNVLEAQQQILKLKNELVELDMEIQKVKEENDAIEKQLSDKQQKQQIRKVMEEYENVLESLIVQSEKLLKITIKD